MPSLILVEEDEERTFGHTIKRGVKMAKSVKGLPTMSKLCN